MIFFFYPDGVIVINCTMPVLLSVDKWQVPIFPSSVSNEISKL